MLSAGMSSVLASKGKSCRFLEGVGKVLLGCVPMDVVDGSSGPAQHITFFLRSTECCVGRGPCSPLDGRGGVRSAEGIAMVWGLTALVIVCGDLTALARRCKFTFSCLPGTWCLVGEEVQLTLVVRGEGPGGTEGGDVVPVMTEAGAEVLSKPTFLCAA